MENNSDQEFRFFPQLPTELRLAIWRECLPHRVVEIDNAWDEGAYLLLTPPPCKLQQTTDINRHPPVISRFWSDGSALDHLAWNAAQVGGRGSFMFDYLDNNFDGEVDMEDRVGALQKLQHGAIAMRIIVVHTTFQNAALTGLFGLLGDAPIQLVDVSDEPRLYAFFDFAEKCDSDAKGFTKRQGFHRDSSETVKSILKEKLAETFGARAAQTLPQIYPAIMFRLCTRLCNRPFGGFHRTRDICKDSIDRSSPY
ncbi:hypothetical protein N7474_009634 [Penicillium riverlandense]|uniref:uncharacterized protein n=1 Tax=Penicillium riverlandense TaxID=1903569 RepID=UPI002549AD0A|nr:uncharacterized protein N7474_009634 [Penicillium riverlandense]KAJ5808365.1 hypothetical protein N7474_009634 [Penicillium riverlandense]